MKKPTLIAAGVLVALLVVFFALRGIDDNAPAPIDFEVPRIDNLEKVEITQGDKKVVLAREGDKWRLKAPVDYPVSEGAQKDLDKLFGAAIGMDRTLEAGADPARYGLDKDTALVAIYAGGEKKIAFVVGSEATVSGTFVKRTWVKPEGGDRIYRAKEGLRTKLVLDDFNKLREKKLLDFKKEDVASIELSYEGREFTFERAPGEGEEAKETWKSTSPAGEKLDVAAIDRLASAAGRLRAEGFGDGVALPAAGLDKPALRASFKLKEGKAHTILLGGEVKAEGEEAPKGGPARHIKLGDADWIYTVSSSTASQLDKRLADLRSKDMMTVETSQVEKIAISVPGKKKAEVVLVEGAWKLIAPTESEASKDLVDAALRAVGALKAARVPDVTAEASGLVPESAIQIVFTLAGGDVRNVFVGKKVDEAKEDRYVRVGETGPIFELAGFQASKLLKLNAADLSKVDEKSN